MKLTPDEQSPVLDMETPVILKVRDLMKLNQILTRTYDEEERLRETLSPILQELRSALSTAVSDPEWQTLAKWDAEPDVLALAVERQKKHVKRIKRALVKNRNLRLRYCTPGSGEIIRSTVIPLELWETVSGWLLRAFSYQNGEERTYRVERILKAKQKSCGKTGLKYQHAAGSAVDISVEEMASLSEDVWVEDDRDPLGTEDPDAVLLAACEASDAADSLEGATPDVVEHPGLGSAVSHGVKHPHYSLPGKKPHQPGLPNRLERLIKRAERKTD